MTWGPQGPPVYLGLECLGYCSDAESRTDRGEKVENNDIPSQRALPSGPRTRGHSERWEDAGTHRHGHVLRELLRQPQSCPGQGLSLTSSWCQQAASAPDSGHTACPSVRRRRPLPAPGPRIGGVLAPGSGLPSRRWPCPHPRALRITCGEVAGGEQGGGPTLALLG